MFELLNTKLVSSKFLPPNKDRNFKYISLDSILKCFTCSTHKTTIVKVTDC